ncbi:alkaline phosphatase family protein [Collimonas sp.]|uniref:alkaline phosphatase family protein n=1 Tax=Collimonas sp. TaxID=1963772 RepID=UPI002BA1756D|nr:alkaline phosphatase family protein [Collimonas sp.]HWW08566.1 alkaline phosphatase family protein [Collimonas sp.]
MSLKKNDFSTQFAARILKPALACVAGVALLACAGAVHATGSGNLIVNGGGETGLCATDWKAVKTVPGWQVLLGSPTLVCYSVASFTTPSSPAAGNAFIADGPYGDSALMQTINVSAAGSAIDTGTVTYSLSGWLGGYAGNAGQAVVTATFLGAAGQVLGNPGELSGVTASARGNANAFIVKSNNGTVPAGTRSIAVQLQFINTSGSYNVGYADNLSLTLSTPVPAPALVAPASTVPAFDHVFFVMMENTDYSQVIGDTANAPFINSLAQSGTLMTNYSGVYHPSDENYLAVSGGDTFVTGAIYFPNIKVSASHIGDRLEAVGKTWKAYEQGMGTPCNTKNNFDSYYQPDDAPFINYTNISGNPTRCAAHLFDTTQLTTDLQSASTTPNFSWIAADDNADGEASGNGSANSLQVQDGWLKQTLQPIFASPAWINERSLLILTWDESSGSVANHIGGIVYGSQGLVGSGALSTASYNHYSVGRTIENALGIGPLTANDTYAQPINDAFTPNAKAAASSFSVAMPNVKQGENIAFNFSTTPANTNSSNWVGIYAAGASPGTNSSALWQYVAAEGGVTSFSTASLAPGTYTAWYLYNGGYVKLAGPATFVVSQ